MALPRARLDVPLTFSQAEVLINQNERIIEILKKFLETVEVDYAIVPYQRDMEFYDYDEQASITVTTAPGLNHEFKERPVKFMWLYAQGANIQVALDNAVTGESMVVPAGAIIWVKKKARRVYGQAVAGSGTLYIWGFW